jgi:hypothetical protein
MNCIKGTCDLGGEQRGRERQRVMKIEVEFGMG